MNLHVVKIYAAMWLDGKQVGSNDNGMYEQMQVGDILQIFTSSIIPKGEYKVVKRTWRIINSTGANLDLQIKKVI